LKKITVATEEPSTMAIANGPALVINSTKLNIRESNSIRISYRIPLKITESVLDITVDMTGERYALSPIGEFEILTRFKMSRPIRTSISPSHRISVEKESNERRLISVRERDIRRPSDFRLLTSLGGNGLDLKLLFYPSTKKGGHFLAMVEPPLSWLDKRQPSLDLAILLDCSGSIGIEHLKLGKRAISLFLGKLRPLDRFEMMKITSRPRRLFGRLVEAMPRLPNCLPAASSSGCPAQWSNERDDSRSTTKPGPVWGPGSLFSGRPHRVEELADLLLESVAVARQ